MDSNNVTITFYINYLNHHQVFIADELYSLLGDNFRFVATLPRDTMELKGGFDYSNRPYCISAGESNKAHEEAIHLAKVSDVCVFGAFSQEYALIRAKQNGCGLSFEVAERWLKKGWLNILSPRLRKWWWNYQWYYRSKPFYKLCSSAFAAEDDHKMFAYRGRHFKWGYFTKVDENFEVEISRNQGVLTSELTTHIMWCGRFLRWKHPELPVRMALMLKSLGYNFILDMYGTGELEKETKRLVQELSVGDVVEFHGMLPNEEIVKAMRKHDIFLFTSDRNEGWGAVANEAMTNGCVLVASEDIGSIPYLVKEEINGLTFKSKNVNSLTERVKWLLDNPNNMYMMQMEARRTMVELWSPKKAAIALLHLIDDLLNERDCSIKEGPCSIA